MYPLNSEFSSGHPCHSKYNLNWPATHFLNSSPVKLSSFHSTQSTLALLWFLEPVGQALASGSLHLLFLLPPSFFFQIFTGLALPLPSHFCLIVQRGFLWLPYIKISPSLTAVTCYLLTWFYPSYHLWYGIHLPVCPVSTHQNGYSRRYGVHC